MFIFVFYTWQFKKYRSRKQIGFAWDSNPGQQDETRRRIHWAMAAPLSEGCCLQSKIQDGCSVENFLDSSKIEFNFVNEHAAVKIQIVYYLSACNLFKVLGKHNWILKATFSWSIHGLFFVSFWTFQKSLMLPLLHLDGDHFFKKNGPNPVSFWFIFVLFHNTRTNIVQISL